MSKFHQTNSGLTAPSGDVKQAKVPRRNLYHEISENIHIGTYSHSRLLKQPLGEQDYMSRSYEVCTVC